ncbi:glycosyltransferase family 25 protein [Pontibacter sp. 172403-2]|uniref:glycosyltransferase family 25 protein n=1 Tax=Pontibacter rufus TaxID=2791028 RepID=UPI0018B00880|nr:glycosyltransferase family 25 protein [Pontibacter sp. 172403-2]MBF9254863.1 glycosyltransferase family 25 protein [Pontibacter sp. 172403-2]
MMRYKIFVINLKRDFARNVFITNHLNSLGLNFTLVEAIDVLGLTPAVYKELVDEAAIAPKVKWLTKGAIGCALSHLKVYEMIVRQDLDYALVLEDDCLLDNTTAFILEDLAHNLALNEVVLLHYRSWKTIHLAQARSTQLTGKYRLYEPQKPYSLGSAVAYVITREACRNLSGFLLPVRGSSDEWNRFLREGIIKSIRCVYPMPIDTADFKSSIDYVPPGSLRGKLAAFIDKNKIFPAYQYLHYRRRKIKRKLQKVELTD